LIAKEKGYFDKYGMTDVEIAKQASWAVTRDNWCWVLVAVVLMGHAF